MPTDEPHRNPFEGVTDYFSELSRMRATGTHGGEPTHEGRQRTHASAWVPPTDIFVRGDDIVITVELAGVDPDEIDLRFAHGVLTVSGHRGTGPGAEAGADGDVFYVRERFHGEFRRAITLPEGTEQEQISAVFDDGLVEVSVADAVRHADTSRIQLQNRSSAATRRRLR